MFIAFCVLAAFLGRIELPENVLFAIFDNNLTTSAEGVSGIPGQPLISQFNELLVCVTYNRRVRLMPVIDNAAR